MAWTTPRTWVDGETVTAALLNAHIKDNLAILSGFSYTTEAARATAIPAPWTGQRALLTAPTGATAAGTVTVVPAVLETQWNGAVWVCKSPIGARGTAFGTTTSTTFTPTLSGSPGTNPAVTLVTGTSVRITLGGLLSNGTAGTQSQLSVAVSGSTTVAAVEAYAMISTRGDTYLDTGSRSFLLGGLTAGSNTFTIQYKVGAGTGTFYYPNLIVEGL